MDPADRWKRLLPLLLLTSLAACYCATPTATPPTPAQPTSAPPATAATPTPDVTPEAALRLLGALQRAQERAQDAAPGAPAALEVRQRATRLAADRLHPDLLDAAQRRVALAQNAASLRTAWPALASQAAPAPAPPPAARRGRRARRPPPPRRAAIPQGELRILYGKGGGALRVQLFDPDGQMRPEAYVTLCRALYEPQHEDSPVEAPWIAYDPRLFTLLYLVGQHFDAPVEIISAYRKPGRRARTSNHNTGHAADIDVKGTSRHALLAFVESTFDQIGAGWYPRSTFIHLDTRDRSYYWTDTSRPGKATRHRERPRVRKPKPGKDPTTRSIHVTPWP